MTSPDSAAEHSDTKNSCDDCRQNREKPDSETPKTSSATDSETNHKANQESVKITQNAEKNHKVLQERTKSAPDGVSYHKATQNKNKNRKSEPQKSTKVPAEEDEKEAEAQLVVPPDGGWGWVVAFASFMCNVMVDGIIFSFGTLKSQIGDEFKVSNAKVALVGSLLSGFYLLVGPFVSAIANRYGFRLVVILGSALSVGAFCLSYFSTSIEFLYVSYGLAGGVGFGLIYVPAVIAVGFYFERWRALATGIAVCGSGIGAFALAPIFSSLATSAGWRSTMFLQAALAGSCALFGILFRPLKPTRVDLAEVEQLETQPTNLSVPAAENTPTSHRHVYPTVAETWTKSTASLHKSVHSLHVNDHTSGASQRRHSLRTGAVKHQELEGDRVRGRRGTISGSSDANAPVRPMYRDDIFFGGSLARLPQYTSHTSIGYTMSVTRLPTQADLEEETSGAPCRLCPEAVRRTLATMLDMSLMNSPSFVLLAVSGGLTMMGFYVPFMYLQERADLEGMSEHLSMWLVSSVGICNTAGRLLCGFLSSSVKGVDTLMVSNIALCIGGLSTLLSGVSMSDTYQFTYCCVFGLSIACFASLRSVIMVDLVGLENLTNAFGLSLVFQGIAAVVGAPLAGAFKDATGNYDATFYLSGGLILFSGLMCFPLKALNRWELARRKAQTSAPV